MILPLFTDHVPERIRRVVDILYTLEEWPRDWSKDVGLVESLFKLYPEMDLQAEALTWVAWFQDWRQKHPRKEVKHRARFIQWCKNSKAWSRRRPRGPADKDAHGETRMGGW